MQPATLACRRVAGSSALFSQLSPCLAFSQRQRTRFTHSRGDNVQESTAEAPDAGSVKKSSPLVMQARSRTTQEQDDNSASAAAPWQVQKAALQKKFGERGWQPRRRVSPDTLEGIRQLHQQDPVKFSTPALAEQFQISPEAIRRILKSKWRPSETERKNRAQRWERRGESIWTRLNELGVKPPKKWRELNQQRVSSGQPPLPRPPVAGSMLVERDDVAKKALPPGERLPYTMTLGDRIA